MSFVRKSICWIFLSVLFSSCATARLPDQGNIKAPIEMKTYRITLANERDWKDWAASTKPENDTLILQRLRIWPLTGEVQGYITMEVMRDTIAPQAWGLTESEHADNIRSLEEKIMREKGEGEGRYEIDDLTKGDILRNGKKLYFMTWSATQRGRDSGPGNTRSL